MSWRKGIQLLLLSSLAIANAGCLAVAAAGAAGAGAATYIYFKGRVCQEYSGTFKDAYYAVIAGLEDLKYPILSQKNDGGSGTFTSKTEDGTNVTIDLSTQTNESGGSVIRVCVRVGPLGDQIASERILSKLSARLAPGAARPEAVPPVAQGGQAGVIQPVGWNRPGETAPPPELPADPMPPRR